MYECKKAYFMDGTPYIVCGLEPKPDENDKANIYHSLCPYQRFCGERRCAVMLPEWRDCKKLANQSPKTAVKSAETVDKGNISPNKTSRKSSRKI